MHDPTHEYDDDCEGCQPAMMDLSSGKPLSVDDPAIILIRKVFKENTTLTERRAWGRVVMQNSRNTVDLQIFQKISVMMQEALKSLEEENG